MKNTRSLKNILNIINDATNPGAFRTDHEANRQRARARAARNALIKNGYVEGRHYRESDSSGRLLAMGIYR
jgi:hypothetical protein